MRNNREDIGRLIPVSTSFAVIAAPATVALEGSVTVPEIVAVTCAKALEAHKTITTTNACRMSHSPCINCSVKFGTNQRIHIRFNMDTNDMSNRMDTIIESTGAYCKLNAWGKEVLYGRTIMTSVDLTSAAAVSPTFKRISRTASAVMIDVMCCPPNERLT